MPRVSETRPATPSSPAISLFQTIAIVLLWNGLAPVFWLSSAIFAAGGCASRPR